MLTAILLATTLVTAPEVAIDPQEACEVASTVLIDMRKVEGRVKSPGDFSHPKSKARIASCVEIASLAAPHGKDVVFASIAVAYNESNFDKVRRGKPLVGKHGEEGRMQVMFKHHCKGVPDLDNGKGSCTNPDRAGVRALRGYLASVPSSRCVATEKAWIRALRKRRVAEGGIQTVLRPVHASRICQIRHYNGSRKYGRRVTSFYVSIQRAWDKHQQKSSLARGVQ